MDLDPILNRVLKGNFDEAQSVIETLNPGTARQIAQLALHTKSHHNAEFERLLKEIGEVEVSDEERFYIDLIRYGHSLQNHLMDYSQHNEVLTNLEERLYQLDFPLQKRDAYSKLILMYRGIASLYSGLYRNAESYLLSCMAPVENESTIHGGVNIVIRTYLILTYIELGKYEEALKLSTELYELTIDTNNKQAFARAWLLKGYSEYLNGDSAKGLDDLLDAIGYIKDNKVTDIDKGISYLLVSHIYLSKGEYNVARRFLLSAMEIFEDMNDHRNLAECYSSLGTIYFEQGMFNQALESYQKSLASNLKLGNQLKVAIAMKDIAKVNHAQKADSNYLKYLRIALDQAIKIGNLTLEAELYYYLIKSYDIDTTEFENALNDLKELSEKSKSSDITLLYRLAKSHKLKNSNRIIDKYSAQQEYFDIIENSELHTKFMVDAYLGLFELLLLELKISSESGDEVMDDISRISKKLEHYLETSGSMAIHLQLMVLKSRILLLEQRLDDAQKILEDAEDLATAKGFYLLKEQITNERNSLTSYIAKWIRVIEKNKENIENYQRKKIIEYLNEASKVVELF